MKDEYDKFKAEAFNFGMLILFCATFDDLRLLVIIFFYLIQKSTNNLSLIYSF